MTVEINNGVIRKKTYCPHNITIRFVHPSENDPDFSHSSVTQEIIVIITKEVLH